MLLTKNKVYNTLTIELALKLIYKINSNKTQLLLAVSS